MANQEQLDLLKQGAAMWYQWKKEHPEIGLDLSGADLRLAHLSGADLSRANLSRASLFGTDLSRASLFGTDLSRAYLFGADLNEADLSVADLSEAHLRGANLFGTDLSRANLSRADLRGASLSSAILSHAILSETDFSRANMGWAVLTTIDLRGAKGLETVQHEGPSSIGIDTIYRSQGDIPEAFLKGAGVDDTFITYIRSLVGKAIEYYTCFISYSSKDEAFARRLYADLQSHNVRCWFAPEDLKIGDKFWHRIDESIRLYDKLLVVLSQYSVESEWVEREVIAALEKERQQQKLVLFPITLDEAFKHTYAPWAADIRRTRHVGDFACWKDYEAYQKVFSRLLRDLKA